MADLIKIKGGSGSIPALQDRELAYSKSEKALYIGTSGGNVRLSGENDAVRLNAHDTKLSEISKQIEDIIARLVALETPSK